MLKENRRWSRLAAALVGGLVLALIAPVLLTGQAGAWKSRPAASDGYRVDGVALTSAAQRPAACTARRPSSSYPLCRFGVTVAGDISAYDVASLNVGWYLNWSALIAPPHPGGAEYVQVVRLAQVGPAGFSFRPPTSTLYAILDANPGSAWLIGNEQDRRLYQDDLAPEAYARAYHHLYHLIKARDPSARVAAGGVVQPTPLRFQYLDAVWEAYWDEYGRPMPSDFWNVHSFILREISPDHPLAQQPGYEVWGAGIPRGAQFDHVMEGILYKVSQQDDMTIFRQRILEFRRWMADRGQRHKPLMVTEYGVLFPEDYSDENGLPLSASRVSAFMQSTFDFFRTFTDASIGYPADGNRLVQRWAWFSVDGDPYLWGGSLFDLDTHAPRFIGESFRQYTQALSPAVDLITVQAYGEPAAVLYEGKPVTVSLAALISNAGDVPAAPPIVVTFYAGPPGAPVIGEPRVITQNLAGCASSTLVSVTWKGLELGAHPFSVQVSSSQADVNPANDTAAGVVLVASYRMFLPAALKMAR